MRNKALAFYHEEGLVPAWKMASDYAGKGGHLATVQDVILARLNSAPEDPAWTTWFTTTSFEAVGYSKNGRLVIIVGHGNLPLASLDNVLKAYSFQYKDKSRNNRGGRISQEEFLKLESGVYGDVAVIDLAIYLSNYEYPFLEPIGSDQALKDALVRARLGDNCEAYVHLHRSMAIEFEKAQRRTVRYPFILTMRDAANCPYRYFDKISPDGEPLFHLLSISAMTEVTYSEYAGSKLTTDVSAHEWWNGTKFVGVPRDCRLDGIISAPNARDILKKHWKDLRVLTIGRSTPFARLMQMGDSWFSMYEKNGVSIDTGEPEFVAKSVEFVGKPVGFITEVAGYYGFFAYDVRQVKAIAPNGANSYFFVNDPHLVNSGHQQAVTIQFCQSNFDTNWRIKRAEEIWHDPQLMMKYALMEE